MKSTMIVDLDGTLAVDDKRTAYPDRPLNPAIARAVAVAREQGYAVTVVTARGMRTYGNDQEAVERHVRPQVEAWLRVRHVACDGLIVGKPWCGPRGFYVDDRAMHLEEFTFRFSGPFAGLPVDVRIPPSEEPVQILHSRLVRLERWFAVTAYRYGGVPVPELVKQDDRVDPPFESAGGLVLWIAGRGRIDPAGWLSLHHEAIPVASAGAVDLGGGGRSGFALIPLAVFEDIGPSLDALGDWVRRKGGLVVGSEP
jgi:capsule biosynthesis phosphatase